MLFHLNKLFLNSVILLFSLSLYAQPSVWISKGAGGGGSLFSPSFSPNNPNEIYMGCDMSELFHSTNLGATWAPVNFAAFQGGSNSQVQFINNNPQILYCINHINDISTPSKSTDAGISWSNLVSDPTGGDAYSLFADINNANNIIVTDYTRLWYSNNGGNTFSLKYTSASAGGCYAAGVFFDSLNIFVGTNDGLLISTNSGSTFILTALNGIPSAQGLLSFAGAKQSGVTRFFGVTADKNNIYAGIPGSDYWGLALGIYSIDYGQPNWSLKTTGINLSSDFPFYVSMARNNINTAYLGGSNSNGFPTVFKTTNAGSNWANTFITQTNQNIITGWSGSGGDRGWGYGECAMGFTVAPFDANKIAITDLGFIHISSTGGSTWQQGYVTQATQNPMNTNIIPGKPYETNGLENTSCWWLSWLDANNMFASFTDIKGTRSTNAGATWSFNYTGHSQNTMYYTLKHPNGILYGASSTVHDMYQSTYLTDARIDAGQGKILFSSDNGFTWNTMHDFLHPVIWLAKDPNNINRMYASVIHSTLGGIFVSNDIQNGSGSTWTRVSLPPRTEGHPFNIQVLNDGMLVCTYSGRRNTAGTFTASSGVFVSTNSGTSWIDRSHTGMLYWTKDIVIYPYDASQNTWYAGVFSGWGGPPNGLGGLYRTTNRGVNWTKINNTDRVTSITFSPVNPDNAFMTSETNGLFYSSNISSANPTFSSVTSYPFRQPERVFYNPFNTNEIWVSSFGNGLRMGSTVTGLENENGGIPRQFMLHNNYPNPFNPSTIIKFDVPKSSNVKIIIYDISGRAVKELINTFINAGPYRIEFNAENLSSGIYFCRLEAGEFVDSKKMVLVK